MESFVVSCPCPEVWEMLNALAAKAGYLGGEDCVSRHWFLIRDNGCVDAGCRRFVYDNTYGPTISIEAAIAELQKPREKPLMAGEHKVTINPDRSVTVGCTNVPAEVCDEIEKRRGANKKWHYFHWGNLYRVDAIHDERWISSCWLRCTNVWKLSDHLGHHPGAEITEAEARQRFPEAFKE